MTSGYCFRCKEEREMENFKESKLNNGRKILKGICKDCGCKITKFL